MNETDNKRARGKQIASQVLLFAATAVMSGCGGCSFSNVSPCSPPCARGFVCEAATTTCVSDELERWDKDVPGRAIKLTVVQGRVIVAMIEPESNTLIVGQYASSQLSNLRILSETVRSASTTIALDAKEEQTAVVWIDRTGVFKVATRKTLSSAWSIDTVTPRDAQGQEIEIRPTDDFDFTISESGDQHIIFRDGSTNTVSHLFKKIEAPVLQLSGTTSPSSSSGDDISGWQLGVLDDGNSLGHIECPQPTRDQRKLGLGYDVDLFSSNKGLFAAYHDADCGDLRLASLPSNSSSWSVSLLAGRDNRNDPTSTITGRHPSLAEDSTGNLAMAYQDLSKGRLMYAISRGEAFEHEVVDRGEILAKTSQRTKKIVGAFARLSFDENDSPNITYFDASDGDLLRARRSQGAALDRWDISNLSSDGLVGFFATHLYLPNLGLIVAAEKLNPTTQGMRSQLILLEEVSP